MDVSIARKAKLLSWWLTSNRQNSAIMCLPSTKPRLERRAKAVTKPILLLVRDCCQNIPRYNKNCTSFFFFLHSYERCSQCLGWCLILKIPELFVQHLHCFIEGDWVSRGSHTRNAERRDSHRRPRFLPQGVLSASIHAWFTPASSNDLTKIMKQLWRYMYT